MQALLTVILSDYHGIVPLNFVMVWRINCEEPVICLKTEETPLRSRV